MFLLPCRWLWLVLAAILAPGSAWLLAGPQPARAEQSAPALTPLTPHVLAPWERPATVPAQAASAPGPAAQAQPDPALTLRRHADGEIFIEARAASLGEAATALSALTQSELRLGSRHALPESRTLTITWRGHDVGQAWQALLGAGASHAMQCQAQRCRVWLLSAGAAANEPGASPPPSAQAPMPAAPRASDLLSGTPPPAATVAQPDPPGLFPSD